LELARQHSRHHPGPASKALLCKALLAIIEREARGGRTRAAEQFLAEAEVAVGDDLQWSAPLAELAATLGDAPRALALASRLPEGSARLRVVRKLADWAIAEGPRARPRLPADWQPAFDLVLTAFGHYESGRDDEARAALQGIALQSPFSEWKLLLRGLISFSADDDTRAAENWQRLDPGALPARLAAPLRARVDSAFRAAQPQQVSARLERQFLQLYRGGLALQLQELQRNLAAGKDLSRAWNQLASIVPDAKREAPELLPRLARIMYWMIVRVGDEPDARRFVQLFGAPPDDPNFQRCQALISEQHDDLANAHKHWQHYDQWIAASPQRWPEPQRSRARSLIWERLGKNALAQLEAIEEQEEEEDDPITSFFSMLNKLRDQSLGEQELEPLLPPADDCFRQAAALDPQRREPVAQLFRVYFEDGRTEPAEQVAHQLLERFPNDLPTLEAMADIHEQKGDTAEALEFRRRALEANPLDRRLLLPFSRAALNQARALAIDGDADGARALIREAMAHGGPVAARIGRCLTEMVVRKLGMLAQLEEETLPAAESTPPSAAIYHRAVEASRVKLAKKDRQPFESALADFLAGSQPLGELLPVVEGIDFYRRERIGYRGLQTHEKKVWALAEKALRAGPSETELVRAGFALLRARAWRPLMVSIEQGRRRFPQNANFPFLEAELYLKKQTRRRVEHLIGTALQQALELATAAHDGRYRNVKEAIEQIRREHPQLEYFFTGKWPDQDDN
jgi:tetratricopeptide (TPR) repeat protein